MKIHLPLALFGALALAAPVFSPTALAQTDEAAKRSWRGIATLKTLAKTERTRELSAVYPIFSGRLAVAQVAGLKLKREAVEGFYAFEKGSRGSAQELGLGGNLIYSYAYTPTLVLSRPRFISATAFTYSFTGGAHGMYSTEAYNFGYAAGATKPRQLKLADFFTDGAAASKRVNALLMTKLRATKAGGAEATWVLEGEVKAVDKALMENFVAEKDGLRWYFAPYAMGPFAAGEIEVKLSARELGPRFRASLLR